MVKTESYSPKFVSSLVNGISKQSNVEDAAIKIGSKLKDTEEKYLKLLKSKDVDEGELKAAELKYQKAVRVFEGFSQFMRNSFQIMMQNIRALNVR